MSKMLVLTEVLCYDISGIMVQKRLSASSSIREIEMPLFLLVFCSSNFYVPRAAPKIQLFVFSNGPSDDTHRGTGKQPLMLLKNVRSGLVVSSDTPLIFHQDCSERFAIYSPTDLFNRTSPRRLREDAQRHRIRPQVS